MPIQAPSWTDFLSCPICCNEFAVNQRLPISLGCGHTICRQCLATLHNRQCPFDQTSITTDVDNLPINNALLQLVSTNTNNNTSKSHNNNNIGNVTDNNSNNGCGGGAGRPGSDFDSIAITGNTPPSVRQLNPEDLKCYNLSNKYIESLALYLKSLFSNNGNFGSPLSRPMQRKLVTLVNCQLMESEGRVRVLRAARSLGERTVTELIVQHQNPQQLSSNLWAAVRSRGCQFLGPAMQEEVLKLVLQALEDGTALSRKVLVMFVVQRLEPRFPQASKTSIGHVVQLLYRASCFKVSKREADSSLMQLKEEFRTYDALRREHDAQIVQIATEAGLRIAPDQWSSLLYGDTVHKSHMQSIIDKLQTPSSFAQSVQELVIALQRTGDPANLSGLRIHLKNLAVIDPSLESPPPTWQDVAKALEAVHEVVVGLVEFVQQHGSRKLQECTAGQGNTNTKYKISLCRDLTVRRNCPRGSSCTFAHSEEELEKFRAKNRKNTKPSSGGGPSGIIGSIGNIGVTTATNLKKDFPSHAHTQNHGHGHGLHNPHTTAMLHPGSDNSAPVSAVTSPLRFSGPTPIRSGYGEATSPLHAHGPPSAHHHMRPLHHSPIPPNNAQTMPIQLAAHRYDTPAFGSAMNYPSTTPGIPTRVPNSMANVNSSTMLSPRNFSTALQSSPSLPPLPPSLTTVNPPKYNSNNNASATLGSPLNSKRIYNEMSPEFYKAGRPVVNSRSSSLFSNNNNSSGGGINGNNSSCNSNILMDLKVGLGGSGKVRQSSVRGMWDQQHHQQMVVNTSAVAEMLSGVGGTPTNQPSSMYPPSDTASVFAKKVNNINMELNKTISGLGIGDTYMFKHNFGAGSNTVMPRTTTSNVSNNKGNLLYSNLQAPQTSFWHTSTSNTCGSGIRTDNSQERNSIVHNMGIGSAPGPFRDRDSFVRSDSILDDDAATFDVPATSASIGSKFGPICPMYKGHGSTAAAVTCTNTYLDSWSCGDGQSQTANKALPGEHPLLDRNDSGDINYSVFTNDTENSLPLQFHKQFTQSANAQQQQSQHHQKQQQQPHRPCAFDNFSNLQNALLPDLQFSHMKSLSNGGSGSVGDDVVNFELGLNAFQNMLTGVDDNANIDMNKSSSMWSSDMKVINTNLWNDSISPTAPAPKELQHQQQQYQQQMRRINSKGRNSEEGIIDSGRMRDIEQELSEIVDKSWSNADDSGIKL